MSSPSSALCCLLYYYPVCSCLSPIPPLLVLFVGFMVVLLVVIYVSPGSLFCCWRYIPGFSSPTFTYVSNEASTFAPALTFPPGSALFFVGCWLCGDYVMVRVVVWFTWLPFSLYFLSCFLLPRLALSLLRRTDTSNKDEIFDVSPVLQEVPLPYLTDFATQSESGSSDCQLLFVLPCLTAALFFWEICDDAFCSNSNKVETQYGSSFLPSLPPSCGVYNLGSFTAA